MTRKFPTRAYLLLVVVGASLACGIGPPDVSTYDDTCEANDDCETVAGACSACACFAGALNHGGAQQYNDDVANTTCGPFYDSTLCNCPLQGAFCSSGTCDLCDPEGGLGPPLCPADVVERLNLR
jgi:hypothetical protein